MAFRPVRPNSSDYAQSFPEWIVDAIPGAADLREKAEEAVRNATAAAHEAGDAREKLASISDLTYTAASNAPTYSPKGTVKRTVWDRAEDRRRAAVVKLTSANTAAATARKAYWEFVMDGQESEAFIAQTEPLYAEASRRAQDHLDALQAALAARDEFALSLGRSIDVEGGNYGLRNALGTITSYVAAGLKDHTSRAHANRLLEEAIASNTLLPETIRQLRVEAAAAQDTHTDNPAAAVKDLLRAKGLAR